jgi:hypothetical protein
MVARNHLVLHHLQVASAVGLEALPRNKGTTRVKPPPPPAAQGFDPVPRPTRHP